MSSGGRARRACWPPDAFLIHVPGSTITVEADRPLGKAAPELVGEQITYAPHLDLYCDRHMSPWDRSINDAEATDWEII